MKIQITNYTDRKDYIRQYQRAWIMQRKLEWIANNGPCAHCGSQVDLEIDHIDPATKVHHNVWSWRKDRREAELAKCQVLCSNCHTRKTNRDIYGIDGPAEHGTGRKVREGCKCNLCYEFDRSRREKYRRQ